MSTRPEQLGRASKHGSKARRQIKQYCNRAHRRAAKHDPEAAPTKRRWSGYWD